MKTKIVFGSLFSIFLILIMPNISAIEYHTIDNDIELRLFQKINERFKKFLIKENVIGNNVLGITFQNLNNLFDYILALIIIILVSLFDIVMKYIDIYPTISKIIAWILLPIFFILALPWSIPVAIWLSIIYNFGSIGEYFNRIDELIDSLPPFFGNILIAFNNLLIYLSIATLIGWLFSLPFVILFIITHYY